MMILPAERMAFVTSDLLPKVASIGVVWLADDEWHMACAGCQLAPLPDTVKAGYNRLQARLEAAQKLVEHAIQCPRTIGFRVSQAEITDAVTTGVHHALDPLLPNLKRLTTELAEVTIRVATVIEAAEQARADGPSD